jgi:hypothetical protein
MRCPRAGKHRVAHTGPRRLSIPIGFGRERRFLARTRLSVAREKLIVRQVWSVLCHRAASA